MKKGVLKLISTLLILSIVTGGSLIGSNLKTVLSKYLDAFYGQNDSEAYKYVSESDKSAKSLEEYLVEDTEEHKTLKKILFKKVSYKIKDVTVLGDKATANVEITRPDIESIAADIFMSILGEAFSGKDDKAIDKTISDKVAEYKDNIPMTTEVQTFNLVKEKDGWKVYLYWEKEKQIKELLVEADQLKNQGKFEDSLMKYNELLILESLSEEAKQGKKEVENKIKEKEAAEENKFYTNTCLEIRNIKFEKEDSLFGYGDYSVSGEIVNHGNRTLKKVEITVYYLNKNKKAISEEKHYTVLKDSLFDGTILKPNYVEKFGYYVGDDVPLGWLKVNIAVTDIEFED